MRGVTRWSAFTSLTQLAASETRRPQAITRAPLWKARRTLAILRTMARDCTRIDRDKARKPLALLLHGRTKARQSCLRASGMSGRVVVTDEDESEEDASDQDAP